MKKQRCHAYADDLFTTIRSLYLLDLNENCHQNLLLMRHLSILSMNFQYILASMSKKNHCYSSNLQ
jgi:hypothetical protein